MNITGVTGGISDLRTVVLAAEAIARLDACPASADISLKRMAEWAMNYLVETPREHLGYEPVFQCHPLRCPPIPKGEDPVVSCDTDARMDWEWYYMREISQSKRGLEVEAAFHGRIRDYVGPDGRVWSAPGCYNEGNTDARYSKADFVIHTWGATKILKSLSEDYIRTKDPKSADLARSVMLALKKMAEWDKEGRCWFTAGMGAYRPDGSVVPNGWNVQPAPVVEPLVTYYLATGDSDALDFARAYSEGMADNCQPDGIRFQPDGTVTGGFPWGPHSHATMHAVWGVAHLGAVSGESRYTDFARRIWDWMLTKGTGTGWFPAGPDSCNETCCISDMMSTAACIAQAGRPAYYDYVERYLRNYISPLQFIVTPEFEEYYRELHRETPSEQVDESLADLRRFQGGIIGGSGLNDYENALLRGTCGFEMFGCCAPEGMRAIHTTWSNVISRLPQSPLGPAGVYVNLSLSRESEWGTVTSFLPDAGRLTVKAESRDDFFLRPPHWAPKESVRAFIGTNGVPVEWSGAYARFAANPGDELTITYPLVGFTHTVSGLWPVTAPDLEMTFHWLGNTVTDSSPTGGRTPLFGDKPRVLPPAPHTGGTH